MTGGRARKRPGRRAAVWAAALVSLAQLAPTFVSGAARAQDGPVYDVTYEARVVPSERAIHMAIELSRGARHVKSLFFRTNPGRQTGFAGDGTVTQSEDGVTWEPPAQGGRLTYVFRVDHLRDERSYDARCASTWAIFRGDDLVPPVRTRQTKGAHSRSRLRFVLPSGWSVAAPYTRLVGGAYRIEHEGRAFDRPTGWFALGDLGVAREDIAETRVAVAGPVRHDLRRLDLLAILRLTLPAFNKIRGEPMPRLLLVGAGDPMWRGGLSGPSSIYLHTGRPLITDDATSPILHEMVHASMSARADDAADWIVEGLAEYYSIELLRRSNMVEEARIEKALDRLRARAREGAGLSIHGGTSAALGVVYMIELNANIRRQSDGRKSIDDVFRVLAKQGGATDLASFTRAVEIAVGTDPATVMPSPPVSPAS